MLSALLFGVLQGLTEFLPVSSSGHLALAMHLVDWREPPLVMELVVHLGTLGAVFALYGRDLIEALMGGVRLLAALFRGQVADLLERDRHAALALAIVVATIPTGSVALALKNLVERTTSTPLAVGVLLCLCGGVLLASRWLPGGDAPLTWWRAALVGLAQGLAVFPGISRSGTTIVAGLALGLTREEAARFSFVASVPAILGASILELDPDVLFSDNGSGLAYLVAAASSLVVGYGALRLLVGLVRRGALWWFALYMIPAGILAALFIR